MDEAFQGPSCTLYPRNLQSHSVCRSDIAIQFITVTDNNFREILVLSPEMQRIFPFEDQLYLYEALSVLISAVESSQQNQYIQVVVSMLVQQLEEIMTKELYKVGVSRSSD